MPFLLAWILVAAAEAYAVAGVLFALAFLPRGIVRVDERLHESPVSVRVLLFPGIAALWPLFAWRWMTGSRRSRGAQSASPRRGATLMIRPLRRYHRRLIAAIIVDPDARGAARDRASGAGRSDGDAAGAAASAAPMGIGRPTRGGAAR